MPWWCLESYPCSSHPFSSFLAISVWREMECHAEILFKSLADFDVNRVTLIHPLDWHFPHFIWFCWCVDGIMNRAVGSGRFPHSLWEPNQNRDSPSVCPCRSGSSRVQKETKGGTSSDSWIIMKSALVETIEWNIYWFLSSCFDNDDDDDADEGCPDAKQDLLRSTKQHFRRSRVGRGQESRSRDRTASRRKFGFRSRHGGSRIQRNHPKGIST